MTPPVPRRRAPWVLATTTALAVLVGGLTLTAAGTAAEAATVGAGSYTTDPVGPLPSGCGDTVHQPPRSSPPPTRPPGRCPPTTGGRRCCGRRPTAPTASRCTPTRCPTTAFSDGLGFSPHVHAGDHRHRDRRGRVQLPLHRRTSGSAWPGSTRRSSRSTAGRDWTVTPYWSDGARTLRATIGHGLPFAYFQATGGDAQISADRRRRPSGPNSGATIGFTVRGHDYVAYAPTGATWTVVAARRSPPPWPARATSPSPLLPPTAEQRPHRARPGRHLRPVRPRPRHRHPGRATPTTRRPAR